MTAQKIESLLSLVESSHFADMIWFKQGQWTWIQGKMQKLAQRQFVICTCVTKKVSLTPKECSTAPLKASKMRRAPPLVERRMSLPSLLNLSPVHSHVRSYWSLKVAKGPCWQEETWIFCSNLTTNQKISVCLRLIKHKENTEYVRVKWHV